MRRSPALWLALALAVSIRGPLRAQVPEPEPAPAEEAGPLVTSIEVRSDAPLDPALDLATLIELEVGQPLTEEEVRHTLRNLQASGTAAETELYTREDPEGGGVVAVIVFRSVVQVGEVRIEGSLGLPRDSLRRVIPQAEGQPLSEDQVLRGVFELQDLYERTGYFHAVARVAVETDPENRRAIVIYQVGAGPRTVVQTVAFDHPVDPFPAAQLVRELRLKPGEPFSRRIAGEDAERLQAWLVRQGHGQARVDEPVEEIDREGNTVKLTYPIQVGPKISLVVQGAEERALRREGLLPFLGESGYDEALVLQSQALIKTYYQRQGHYDVQVETSEQRTEGNLVLTLKITPGPLYTLEEIIFQGNDEMTDADLRKLMATSEKSVLRRGTGRLVQADLDADLDNLRRYYALQGYTQATVGPAEVGREGEILVLVIPIQEGPRQRVVRIDFQGFDGMDLDPLRRNLPLREGGGFHPILLDNTLESLRAEYGARGYSQAQVSARQDWNPEHTLVDVTFEAIPGPRQVVDRIIVRGNQRTVGDVIRRTLDLDTGDPVSQARLVETERGLYQLGIFSRVDVELVKAGLDETERDVLIRVEEGKPRSLLYGVGWDSEDQFRFLVGFNNNNLFGRAYGLRTDLRWSQTDKRFHLLVNQPYLGDHPVALTSTIFYEDEARRERNYQVVRYGARTEAVRVYGQRRVSAALDYRIVEPTVDPGIASNEIERRDQQYQVTSFIPGFFWDRRDDPIQATRGWSTLLQLQYAFPVPAIKTDTEFLKLFLQQTQYFNLGRPGVLVANARFGGIEPYKALATLPDDPLAGFPSHDIPIVERFFAGGDASHRAYDRDDLGIRGETLILSSSGKSYLPVGGNGLLLVNLEYRFPVFGAFGGSIFFDSGNVWADWRSIDFAEMKNGVGIGARYISPIGPIRAGIGWKLDREKGEPGYALFLNIGNPF
ncbi:MAG: outer membrane protein assembly factor BamA [Thermoanaerobaculia bacterium]